MNTIIRKGVSIIQMPPQKKRINNKTGVLGTWLADGKYKAEIHYNGKKYHLGSYEKLADAKKIRETAEAKKEDGTLPEWYASTFLSKENKHGVKGLFFRKERKQYTLRISFKGKKYNLTKIETIEEATILRSEADLHIEDGTFIEWFEQLKKK